MMTRLATASVLLLMLPRLATGEEPQLKPRLLYGRFVRVIDGDTLVVNTRDGKELTLDLWGIDAPELGQPNGDRARKYVKDLIEKTRDPLFKYDLWIKEKLTDENGAMLGIVKVVVGHSIPELRRAVGEEVHLQIIRAGWAWHDKENAPDDRKLAAAKKEAREAKRGLWAGETPVPPWEWRKQHGQDKVEQETRKFPRSRRRFRQQYHGTAAEPSHLRWWCKRR